MFGSRSSYDSDDFNSKKTQSIAAVATGLIFVVLGVPIWWNTTKVYRANLPFTEIAELNQDAGLKVGINVNVVVADNCDFEAVKSKLEDYFGNFGGSVSAKPIFVKYNVTYSPKSVDLGLEGEVAGTIRVAVSCGNFDDFKINVETNREISAQIGRKTENLDEFGKILVEVLKQGVVGEEMLEEVVANIRKEGGSGRKDEELMKMVPPSSEFEVIFTLLCPDAEKMTWDVERAILEHITPILEELKPIFHFHISSQVLYSTKLRVRPKIMKNSTTNEVKYHYLQGNQLSNIINSIESRLGSHLSTFPTLNFVLYLTDISNNPLYIQKGDGSPSKSNNFLLPRWGGMTIYNPQEGAREVDLDSVMPTFLTNLRTLVGLRNNYPNIDKQVIFKPPTWPGITGWETDYLLRLRSVENVATSTNTLGSLEKLLHQIDNIIINDDVADSVFQSVAAIVEAKQAISVGNLTRAMSSSRDAFVSSQSAFFHPSLLELLYFPEDQKFAIYVPLFLPISLPVLVSLVFVYKRYKNKDSCDKSKVE
nr:GPI transamidase component PIG-S-like [Ciona intestinalis]|eukprot:XP_002124261.1 GPI transamidase component PIG-S-like [Ciona intestinalis]